MDVVRRRWRHPEAWFLAGGDVAQVMCDVASDVLESCLNVASDVASPASDIAGDDFGLTGRRQRRR